MVRVAPNQHRWARSKTSIRLEGVEYACVGKTTRPQECAKILHAMSAKIMRGTSRVLRTGDGRHVEKRIELQQHLQELYEPTTLPHLGNNLCGTKP